MSSLKCCLKVLGSGGLVLLAACAPLQQAPLLYTSKTTVGLDISSAASETPGGSISIGVKIVDAAYVPVAVSKKLRDDANQRDIASEIVRIEAQFGEGNNTGQLDSLSEENKEKIALYLQAKVSEDRLSANLLRLSRSIKRDEDERNRQQALLAVAKAAVARHGAGTTAEVKKAEIDTVQAAQKKLADLAAEITREQPLLDEQQKKLRESKALTEQRLNEAADAVAFLRTEKRDALSVYGRFNADSAATAGSSPTARLTAGKIFSTGVASQNLTEAVRKEAEASAMAQCLDSVTRLLKELEPGKRAEFMASLQSMCSPQQRRP